MKTSILVLSLVIAVVCVIGNDAQTEKVRSSSFTRCSCIISQKLKDAQKACADQKTFDGNRDCCLKNIGMYSGTGDTDPDVDVAKKLVDEYDASAEQKESLKMSLGTCKAQSKNRPEDNRSCCYEILFRRCASKPCPPKTP